MAIQEYSTCEGIRVPSKMTSTWRLDSEDWTWLKLEVTDIRYNPEKIEFRPSGKKATSIQITKNH